MKKLFLSILFVFVVTSASAVFSGHYLCYRFGGATYQNRLYTSTDDVGPHYMGVRLGGVPLYMMLGTNTRADAEHFRAQVAGTVYAGIPKAYAYYSQFGSAGTGNGQFQAPRGIRNGIVGVYVSDVTLHKVQAFSESGSYLFSFGSYGTSDGSFNAPIGMASYFYTSSPYTYDRLYVVDCLNSRVQYFNIRSGSVSFGGKFGSSGTGNGNFSSPIDVTLDSSHNIYVTDRDNNRVQKFNTSHAYVAQWTGFNSPYGITCDSSDNIYIADAGNDKIKKYNTSGTKLTEWAVTNPYYVSADDQGCLFVTTTENYIYKYSSSGTLLGTYGKGLGSGDGYLNTTYDIDASTGDPFVVDSYNYRIQVFK